MKSILPSVWNLPEQFKSRMGDTAGRQRAMTAEGHLLLVLHSPPQPGEDHRSPRFFWREPDAAWKSSGLGTGVQALKAHLAEYAASLDRLDDELEAANSARDYYRLLQAVAPMHRSTRNLHATLQQARELLPAERELINLRDAAGNLERTAELLHQDIKNGLDFTVANQTEEQSRRGYEMSVAAHRLNLLVAIFFPIATLSTIFGMNLPHGLENQAITTPFLPFWAVLGVGLLSGLVLTGMVARPPAHPRPSRKSK